MNLEDHIGDIVRKARAMSGTAQGDAATAAGLTEGELAGLESSGIVAGKPNWAGLARAIGLDAAKLTRIASGWLPAKKDVGLWRELRVFTTEEEGMGVNCYLVWDEVSREAAMFDTGWNVKEALACIAENGLQLRHLFITHTHEDHVAGLGQVKQAFPKVRMHSSSPHAPVDQRNRPNDFIHLGSLRITNRETKGHADDGTTYVIGNWPEDAPHVAVVGDAIFAGSMGKGNHSWAQAKEGVTKQILTLPDDTLICPGHGPLTTVAEEKANNPFF